jgi:hypothetical protein
MRMVISSGIGRVSLSHKKPLCKAASPTDRPRSPQAGARFKEVLEGIGSRHCNSTGRYGNFPQLSLLPPTPVTKGQAQEAEDTHE